MIYTTMTMLDIAFTTTHIILGTCTNMITISDTAIMQIKKCIKERGSGMGIKFGIEISGCNGLAYNLEYLDSPQKGDQETQKDGIVIAVDHNSLPYIRGTHIDYVREGLNEGFKFTNPNEKASCGCGETFSVD